MRQRIRQVLLSDSSLVEVIVGGVLVVFGGTLLLPYNTFAGSGIYAIMALIAGENVWGIAIVAWGIVVLLAAGHGSIHRRRQAMFISMILLTFVTVSFIITTVTTSTTYIVIIAAALWAYLRLGVKSRE